MSVESVSRAIQNAAQRGPITAQSFAPVAKAVGRYQDARELQQIKALGASMNSGVLRASADGMDAVKKQIAKGDEVAAAEAERIAATPKVKKFFRIANASFALGTLGMGSGYFCAAENIAVSAGLGIAMIGVGLAAWFVSSLFYQKAEDKKDEVRQTLSKTLPD